MDQGIISLVLNATPVAKTVMIILLVMSVFSWAIIISKWLSLRSAGRRADRGLERFLAARDLHEAVQTIGSEPRSPLYGITRRGVDEFNRSKASHSLPETVAENVRLSLQTGVSDTVSKAGGSLSFLATCSNTAPFIGLFGTVWGIMSSFHSIGLMKSASLATVAPGISEALIATAAGLFVAIPATIGYNLCLGKISELEVKLDSFSAAFLNRVRRENNS